MVSLYKKLDISRNIIDSIRDCAISEMDGIDLTTGHIHFLKKTTNTFNQLFEKRLGVKAYTSILFHRPGGYKQPIHNDCNNNQLPINCAINIPIHNCHDSYMEWYEGKYTANVISSTGKDNIIRKYVELIWEDSPKLIERTIIDGPTLVKVDVPHCVTPTALTRSLITVRFLGNPEYTQLMNRL